LRDGFESAFTVAKDLDEEIIQYNAGIVKLKDIISKAGVDASVKNQLLSFASPPSQLSQVSGKVVVADSVKQAIDSAFNSAITRSKDLVDNLALRVKRNKAAMELKSSDDDFRQKTDGKFVSLEQASASILSSEYFSLWKNQEKLSSFSEDFSQAKSLFEKGDYELSMTYSARAKSDAVLVLRDGFQTVAPPVVDWSIWIYFAIFLVVLFAIIFFLRSKTSTSRRSARRCLRNAVRASAFPFSNK